jgi:hypothetical protein
MAIRETQRKLYALFLEFAKNGKRLTVPVILERTGFKENSARPYIAKGFWKRYLKEVADDTYTVHNMDGVSLEDFCASISQKRKEVVLHEQRTQDQELLHHASLEFQLAVELFNRPTTPNRVEAFLVHFCAAWEKLLKARLIREKGPEAIWVKGEKKPKSITLRAALKELYKDGDPVRRNIMEVNALRDESMHYMLSELGPMASRYFQAGVLNFFDTYKAQTGKPPVELSGVGMLSIVFDAEEPEQAILDQKYGKAKAEAILNKIHELGKKAEDSDDRAFAIPLRYAIGFVDKHENPDLTIERLPKEARFVIETTKDPKKTHPLVPGEVVEQVQAKLVKRLTADALSRTLTARQNIAFNMNDFIAICAHEGWKEQNNEYHYNHGVRDLRTYSPKCIDIIVQKLFEDENYLRMVKEKWQRSKGPKRRPSPRSIRQ